MAQEPMKGQQRFAALRALRMKGAHTVQNAAAPPQVLRPCKSRAGGLGLSGRVLAMRQKGARDEQKHPSAGSPSLGGHHGA